MVRSEASQLWGFHLIQRADGIQRGGACCFGFQCKYEFRAIGSRRYLVLM